MKIHKKELEESIGSASVRAAEFVYSSDGPVYIILKQRIGNRLGQKMTAYELEKELAINIQYSKANPVVPKENNKPKPKSKPK